MSAEAEIHQSQIVEINLFHRYAPQQDHAAPVMYFRTPSRDIVGNFGEREARSRQVFVPAAACFEPLDLRFQHRNMVRL